jgi:hypothetical protein
VQKYYPLALLGVHIFAKVTLIAVTNLELHWKPYYQPGKMLSHKKRLKVKHSFPGSFGRPCSLDTSVRFKGYYTSRKQVTEYSICQCITVKFATKYDKLYLPGNFDNAHKGNRYIWRRTYLRLVFLLCGKNHLKFISVPWTSNHQRSPTWTKQKKTRGKSTQWYGLSHQNQYNNGANEHPTVQNIC